MLNPASEAELRDDIAQAAGPVRVVGGGTRGPVQNVDGGQALSLSGLNGVSLYEPGALTLVAAAGTPLDEIEALVAAEGQMLPFEPPSMGAVLGREGRSTIGGVVAANASGPRRVAVGACRDHMLGVRFVDGRGQIISNGGRVMKNVTGYDLVKLMTGSYGTLGVLTEVSLKLLPRPEAQATLVLQEGGLRGAVSAMSMALSSPFEVTGAAYLEGKTCLRVEGFEASVNYRARKLRDTLRGRGEIEVLIGKASAEVWRRVRDLEVFSDHAMVSRVSIPPTASPDFAERFWQTNGADVVLDWGGGLMWFGLNAEHAEGAGPWSGNAASSTEGMPLAAIHGVLQNMASTSPGHATLFKAPDDIWPEVEVFQPERPALARLSAGLRAKFDPRGILNPRLMGG